mgnify:CR=1 FL=1
MTTEEHKYRKTGKIILPPDYFVFVKGGSFRIEGKNANSYQQLTIADFYIARYPLTQGIYDEVMRENPSGFKGTERPVENVSWVEAQEFCKILSSKTGHQYRLPTEAEWEYAAQGGNLAGREKLIYAGSNNLYEVGWYDENSHGETKPVGLLKPNQLSIYDMSGNVWEWCSSRYAPYPYNAKDGREDMDNKEGDLRVFRGGSWGDIAWSCRIAYRDGYTPAIRDSSLGFRLALSIV